MGVEEPEIGPGPKAHLTPDREKLGAEASPRDSVSHPPIRSRHSRLYLLSLAVLTAAAILALIPALFDVTRFLYDVQMYVQAVFIFLSLSVALVTFGVIGDSTGAVRAEWFQFSGSAAGALVFYYILALAVNPYETKLLVIEPSDSGGPTPSEFTLKIDVKELTQEVPTRERQARVQVPKSAAEYRVRIPGHDGRNWKITGVKPPECLVGDNSLRTSCESTFGDVKIHVTGERCISSLRVSTSLHGQRTLKSIIDDFIQDAEGPVMRLRAKASYEAAKQSNQTPSPGYEKFEFSVNGYTAGETDFCHSLSIIERIFNEETKQGIKLMAECGIIYAIPENQYAQRASKDICRSR